MWFTCVLDGRIPSNSVNEPHSFPKAEEGWKDGRIIPFPPPLFSSTPGPGAGAHDGLATGLFLVSVLGVCVRSVICDL